MKNFIMNSKIPDYLLKKRHLIESVAFITVFSVLFMNLYTPFSSTAWFSFKDPKRFLMMVAFYFVSVSFLSVSKMLIYNFNKKVRITYLIYIAWIVSEFIFLALFYTVFTGVFVITDKEMFLEILGKATICIFLILSIPYTIITLYAAYSEQDRVVRLLNKETINDQHNEKKMINLTDNNGNLKLSLDLDTLYFVESQDNYVKIYYDGGNKISSYMLRCRTKSLEKSFEGSSLVRCHRSYIVNTTKIKLFKNDKKSTFLILNHEEISPIPVSSGYIKNVMSIVAENEKKH